MECLERIYSIFSDYMENSQTSKHVLKVLRHVIDQDMALQCKSVMRLSPSVFVTESEEDCIACGRVHR